MGKFKSKLVVSTLATSLVLAGCGGGSNGSKDDKKEVAVDKENGFSTVIKNDDEAIKGGTLKVALVSDSPFKGVFSAEFQQDAFDSDINEFIVGSIFSTDKDFKISNDGIVSLDFDQDAKKATLTIKEDTKWSDGEPLKAEDLVFPYEVIGHKDYEGVRYDEKFMNIVGMEEYHDGKAATISGIKVVDDKTVEINYKEVSPSILSAGGGIWSSAMPKHQLKDIPVKEMEASDAIRKNPIGLGPFVVKTVKAGESIEFTPNKYYFKGQPKVDGMVLTRVPTTSIVEALKAKEYDFALQMPEPSYPAYADLDNLNILGREDYAYSYLGFKLGKWDSAAEEVKTDPKAKMGNVDLRKAMGYAIDKKSIGEKFYNGLRVEAHSLIPPVFKDFQSDEDNGYSYDPDKANELLDEAGYKDVDGDGIREDPDGKPFEIKFLSRSNGDEAAEVAEIIMQQWEEVGLKSSLTTGRLVEFNTFYDKIKADDPDVDVYFGAWSVGTDPTPTGLYGRKAQFNYTRFASDKLDGLLSDIVSSKSFDDEYKETAFKDWQDYMHDEAVVIPMLTYYKVMPVNKRVKNFDWSYGALTGWETIELTAENPL